MMQKIYFRADASVSIGYGHFIRTLALADMLKDNFECTFFTCHPTFYQVSEIEKVCSLIILQEGTHYDDFLAHLQGDEIVVLDNYFFTTDYQCAIKAKGCRLVCIDDMHDKHYVADVVINHGQTNSMLFDVEPYTKLCLGFDWVLLRKPFLEATNRKRISSDSLEKVAICFGGSDIHDMTGYFVNQTLKFPEVRCVTAVVGDAYKSHSKEKADKRLVYRSRLTAEEMADLFCNSDLVICSASSVCIEALACGSKVAVGWYVHNQKEFYSNVCSLKLIQGLGNLNDSENIAIDLDSPSSVNFNHNFSSIPNNYIKLFEQLSREIYLREVEDSDVDILFEWTNDKAVRVNSFSTEPIKYENHVAWFNRCLEREDVYIYILLYKNQLAGVVRLNVEDCSAVISYSISKAFRGKGLGKEIIRLVEQQARANLSIKKIVAFVKPENETSRRIFIKLDYKELFVESENQYKYTKSL